MSEDTIFEPTWRLSSLQMTNWGTFDGSGHLMEFSPRTTLISGAPGSGKSTLLDAYLAVMMPGSRLRFNEASNETTGRNRDASTGQRTLLSYLRGKTGEFREQGSSEKRDKLLRGNKTPTWGAVAANFINETGDQFSAIRLYFVATAASSDSDIVKHGLTAENHIDTDLFHKVVTNKGFRKEDVEAHFPVKWSARSTEFDAIVQLRLGIGAGGEGADALILLSRIQSGKAMESVDSMFKELVLDTPETFERADNVVAAFTDTESAYLASREASEKRTKLEPITDLYTAITDCAARANVYEAIELKALSGASVLRTWMRREEIRQLEAAMETNIEARDRLESERVRAKRHLDEAKARCENLTALIATEGTDLAALEAQQNQAARRLADITEDKAAFDADTQVLGLSLDSANDLAAAQDAAEQFLADFDAEKQHLDSLRSAATYEAGSAKSRARRLQVEREQVAKSKGRMSFRLLQARETIIEHTGLTTEDLPFVGELLDISPEHNRWRVAAEVTLGGLARIMLVDQTYLADFSVSVDALPMHRVQFEGVPLGSGHRASPRGGHISQILQFADESAFIGWVYDRICGSGDDAQRVENPDQLGGATLRVTPAGQTRRGKRGAAGSADLEPVIGFSNEARLAELDEQILAEHHTAQAAGQRADALREQINKLDTLAAAHTAMRRGHWDRLDVAGAGQALESLRRAISDVVNNNPVLKQLRVDKTAADEAFEGARKGEAKVLYRIEDLTTAFDVLGDRETALRGEQTLDVAVSEEQATILAGLYDEVTRGAGAPQYSQEIFTTRRAAVARSLRSQCAQDRQREDSARALLREVFISYNVRWGDDPNRGVDFDSYEQYAQILAQITADEVYLLREKWRQSMDDQAVNHFIQLKNAYDDAHERIEERLTPIRRILATLPFGERRRRISIERDRLVIDEVVALRASIESLTAELAKERSDEEYELRYHHMRAIIDQIRKPEPGAGGAARRRRLLNVNEHIYVTAIEYDPNDHDHREIKRYDQLAPLSGGERQEFVAFMSAAALRYRLGDTHHQRPRFAPVVLDEAFIKANGDFARRGVDAWTELGFQLVIAAPQDKVTGVETLMDERKCITKNAQNRSYISDYRARDEDA